MMMTVSGLGRLQKTGGEKRNRDSRGKERGSPHRGIEWRRTAPLVRVGVLLTLNNDSPATDREKYFNSNIVKESREVKTNGQHGLLQAAGKRAVW